MDRFIEFISVSLSLCGRKKKSLLFLALLLSLGGYSQEAAPLTVMTYNIRHDNPGDGPNQWGKRKDKLCGQVLREAPDILGVQEALDHQVGDLEQLLPGYAWTGVGRDDGKTKGEYAPIFYRKDRFSLLEHGHFWLSPTPDMPGSMGWDAACTRICTWAKLLDQGNHTVVFVFNTHWDHVGKKARLKSAALMKKRIRAIAGKYPVVITGDFNVPPEARAMKILAKNYILTPTSAPSIVNRQSEIRNYSYSGFSVNDPPGELIDHILVPKGSRVLSWQVLTDHADGHYFSDHRPVVARVFF